MGGAAGRLYHPPAACSGLARSIFDPRSSTIRDVRNKLAEVIATHGIEVADDERRLNDVLRQSLGPKCETESLLLMGAAMAGVPEALRGLQGQTLNDAQVLRLARKVIAEFGVTDAMARWSVEAWAGGLGIKTAAPTTRAVPAEVAAVSSSPAADRLPPAVPAPDSPQARLQAAIKEAMADGAITPDERVKLEQLAAEVKRHVAERAAALRAAERRRRIRKLAFTVGPAVLIVGSMLTWWIVREPTVDAADLLARLDAIATDAAAAVESSRKEAAELDDFIVRLDRAAAQAREQGREPFRMGGRSYTQEEAATVLAAARARVELQRSRATAAASAAAAAKSLRAEAAAQRMTAHLRARLAVAIPSAPTTAPAPFDVDAALAR